MAEAGAAPAGKKRKIGLNETDDRVNSTLNFLSGTAPTSSMSAVDNDMYSWMMFNSDLGNLFQPTPLPENIDSIPQVMPQKESPDPPASLTQMPLVNSTDSFKVAPEALDSNSNTFSGLSEIDEKQRRREKQRIIARNFRKRKKERMTELEREVERLRASNRQLQQKLLNSNLQQPTNDLFETHVKELQRHLNSSDLHNKGDQIREIVKEHVAYFSDAGRMRKASVRHHLQELRKLLLPTQITKLCIWGLQQDDAFFQDPRDRTTGEATAVSTETETPSIWNILCQHLKLTEAQQQGIMHNRHYVGEQRGNIATTIQLLEKLDQKISDTFKLNEGLLQSIMQEITPVQQAKYLLWQENNQACMQMLEHVWKITDNKTGEATS